MSILKKSSKDVPEFVAGDHTILKEILHPKNDPVNLPYSLAKAKLLPGKSSTPHRLDCSELYYFLKGRGKIFIDEQETEVEAGDIALVPEKALQHVLNTGDSELEFLCIVAPPWSVDREIVY